MEWFSVAQAVPEKRLKIFSEGVSIDVLNNCLFNTNEIGRHPESVGNWFWCLL